MGWLGGTSTSEGRPACVEDQTGDVKGLVGCVEELGSGPLQARSERTGREAVPLVCLGLALAELFWNGMGLALPSIASVQRGGPS